MSDSQMKEFGYRLYEECFNKHDLDKFDEFFSPDYVEHTEGFPPEYNDPKVAFRMFFTAFPDLHIAVDDMLVDGDKAAVRVTWTGTHRGDFMGIPPTGRSIRVSGVDVGRMAGGKVVEHWGSLDMFNLMRQIGVIQAPGQQVGKAA